MSDIKVGDLVVVVRPWVCCGKNTRGGGLVHVVRSLRLDMGTCAVCGAPAGLVAVMGNQGGACPVNRLKRIPPLSELERVTDKEELHA